jgi:hypothetical protein
MKKNIKKWAAMAMTVAAMSVGMAMTAFAGDPYALKLYGQELQQTYLTIDDSLGVYLAIVDGTNIVRAEDFTLVDETKDKSILEFPAEFNVATWSVDDIKSVAGYAPETGYTKELFDSMFHSCNFYPNEPGSSTREYASMIYLVSAPEGTDPSSLGEAAKFLITVPAADQNQ